MVMVVETQRVNEKAFGYADDGEDQDGRKVLRMSLACLLDAVDERAQSHCHCHRIQYLVGLS